MKKRKTIGFCRFAMELDDNPQGISVWDVHSNNQKIVKSTKSAKKEALKRFEKWLETIEKRF